ncbi:hypothetical protein [Asticcacaulis machinosus]|uniref:DUF4870 domain-containing protein n=1 Tax=Asticcacaulis machinosus TaxID=2984211 RepID=A0ABT5HEY0_9CAUL|nr:hypothetical protein [Asticcacaulis machinosus]MDC7674748.1 hypothetical protein [Asticcacaulis machinosus]
MITDHHRPEASGILTHLGIQNTLGGRNSASSKATSEADERNLAFLVYGLLFVSPFSLGLTALIAAVIAYMRKSQIKNYITSHYAYQIRNFWVVFVLWSMATFIALICTVFLTYTIIQIFMTQYDVTDWRTLDINLNELDTSKIPVVSIITAASGFIVSAFFTLIATLWILTTSTVGFLRLIKHKCIGKDIFQAYADCKTGN